jgi:hypothetical protein
MRRSFLPLVLLGLAGTALAQKLPAEFDHNRIRLAVPAPDGSTLHFTTDSGGGWNAIMRPAARRLKLPHVGTAPDDQHPLPLVAFPDFMVQAGVPAPLADDPYLQGKLIEADDAPWIEQDGFLGSRWFAGHVWRIDYGRHEMVAGKLATPAPGDHAVPLGFQVDEAGRRSTNFGRITVRIDDQDIDMLLDTGATARLTDESAAILKAPAGAFVGSSFIVKSQLDQWHAKHPEWRYIERGDAIGPRPLPMIEVPRVTVAGWTVGPVWFAEKPDANFAAWMSSMMDQPIRGAFGGAGLQYFRIVIDYPKAVAGFGPAGSPS